MRSEQSPPRSQQVELTEEEEKQFFPTKGRSLQGLADSTH